jgi:hypothetical protein
VSPGSVPQGATDKGANDIGNFRLTTERPLGKKAAKRKKRSLESSSSAQADVVYSVRDFSEVMKSDKEIWRMQRKKLRLQENGNRLSMYEMLFLRESSSASQEERKFAES